MSLRRALKTVASAAEVVEQMETRTDRTIAWSAASWALLYLLALLVLNRGAPPEWLRVPIALLPLPAFAWFMWASARWATRLDELERRIQLEALAVAFSLTMLLLMTLGLLQVAIALSMDDWSYRQIWPMLYLFYFVGLVRARKRYR